MYTLFTLIVLIASIFLILIVLVQNSKGGGLAAGFQSSNNIMGVRKTTDFVEKATWWAVAVVVVFSVATVAVHRTDTGKVSAVSTEDLLNRQSTTPGAVNPDFGE
ncbi:MAG: preprotein translocase subunit SecG [Paludibacter sp.]|jgi:preprotein translocase subunit SecG|nr:preprotein translocase subunit SecG [Paludibacter sp.]